MMPRNTKVLLQACVVFFAINCSVLAIAQTDTTKASQPTGTNAPASPAAGTGMSSGTAGGTSTAGKAVVSDACKAALQNLSATLDASHLVRGTARTGTATLISQINDANASPNEKLRAIYATLQGLGIQNLPDGFKTQSDALDAQKTAVDKTCDPASGRDNADQQIASEKTDLTNTLAPYNKGLLSVLSYAATAGDEICKQFAAVPGMAQAADCASIPTPPAPVSNVDDLEKGLAKGLRALAAVMEQRPDFASLWKAISALPAIDSLADSDSTAAKKKINTSITTLKTAEETSTGAISGWLQTVSKDIAAANLSAASASATVLQDPLNNSAGGLSTQKALATKLARVDDVLRAWPSLSVDLQRVGNSHFDDIAQAVDTLRPNVQTMHSLTAQLSDSLAGDMQGFQTESVRLFYFTDVKRLMTALSSASHEIGGLSEAREKAAQERTKLLQAELDLADAQATVGNYQRQVQILKEEQRQQSALVQAAQLLESKTGFNLKRAQQQNAKDNADLDASKEQLKQSPNDPVLQKEVAAAQKRSDNSSAKVQQVDSLHKDAQDKATQAADQQEASKSDANGIQAKIADAQKALEASQAQVQLQRRRTLLSADAESQAFAFARDNTPFFVSEPVGVDTDPVKRVLIFGFPDSASLLLRGLPADVAKVKQIIATFDVPAPQARLTLWTFQLNATLGQNGNKSDAKELNRALEIADEELGNTRALVNTTLGLLRQEISNEVRTIGESDFQASHGHCAPDNIPSAASIPCTSSESEKSSRIQFFSPGTLKVFEVEGQSVPRSKLEDVPDPTATTTLGEALLMLSLTCDGRKRYIRSNLLVHLQDALNGLDLQVRKRDGRRRADLRNDFEITNDQLANMFPLTWRVLGLNGLGAGTDCRADENLTASQFEILYAYEQELRKRDAKQLVSWANELAEYNHQIQQIENDKARVVEQSGIRQGMTPDAARAAGKSDAASATVLRNDPAAQSARQELGRQEAVVISLRENAITRNRQRAIKILSRHNYDDVSAKLLSGETDVALLPGLLEGVATRVESGYERVRTAAADEMLKQFIIAVEDDIDRAFIQPMIYRLRNRLMTETGVGVGIIERESLLATNRLVARIDPRATAQLQVGTETDLLGEAQQLAQLYFTVQSGGATALLGALNKQKREPPPEIYGVGTGNTFQVTPVFDPSGQALRFKFDYVSQTRISEPSGGTNPQLPRMERHTVNTEVQLSNLETREISRFEANSKIGIPESYSGGIPVLKDLPYGRARVWFPVIGWFVRHAGHDAAVQQSVIFGQTTMYPTIADLVQLLAADNLPSSTPNLLGVPNVAPQQQAPAQLPQTTPQSPPQPNAAPNTSRPGGAQPKPPRN
jgi:hypothetical protein